MVFCLIIFEFVLDFNISWFYFKDRLQDPVGFSSAAIRDQDMDSVLSEKTEKDVVSLFEKFCYCWEILIDACGILKFETKG